MDEGRLNLAFYIACRCIVALMVWGRSTTSDTFGTLEKQRRERLGHCLHELGGSGAYISVGNARCRTNLSLGIRDALSLIRDHEYGIAGESRASGFTGYAGILYELAEKVNRKDGNLRELLEALNTLDRAWETR